MDATLTLCGNVTADPVVRYTGNGTAVTSFDIAVNRRWTDTATNTQREATTFCSVQVWRSAAENVGASIKKGMRVIATGRLEQNNWTADDGTARSQLRMVASDVGASLLFGTVEFTRVDRRNTAAVAQATQVEGAPTEEAPVEGADRPAATDGNPGEEPF